MLSTELRAHVGSTAIGSGAFGTVYSDPLDPDRCVKVFNRPVTGSEAQALLRLSEVARWARPSDIDQFTTRFAWPLRTFGSSTAVTGFVMPRAPKSCFFQLTAVNRTQTAILQLKFLMDAGYWNSAAIQSGPPAISDQDRIEIAIDCLDSLQLLHQHGLCYGDLSSNNLCARLDTRPGVFFFDADSISTVDVRALSPLVTPGWETPIGLDPVAIDRSRAAILVLRLLTQDPNVFPERKTTKVLSGATLSSIRSSLAECFASGSEDAAAQLTRDLRSARDQDREERAMREAYNSKFARRVLLELGHKRPFAERHMLGLAELQLEVERSIDEGDGLERRMLMQRAKLRGGPFVLDVKPRIELRDAPTSLDELHQLIYDARFSEIITHFSTVGFGPLDADSWLERGVQHGLVELPDSTLSIQVRPGEASVSFTWPASPYVNCARLRIETGTGSAEQDVVRRDPADPTPVRLVSAPAGISGRVSLAVGSEAPSGRMVFTLRELSHEFTVPPTPRPRVPMNQSGPGSGSPAGLTIIDPVALAAARLKEELELRRARRRLVAKAAVLVVLALVGSRIGYSRWIARSPLEAAAALSNVGDTDSTRRRPISQSAEGSFNVDATTARNQISWFGLPSNVESITIESSSDGVEWLTVPGAYINYRANNATFQVPLGIEGYPMLRLQPIANGEPLGSPQVWPGLPAPGLEAAPEIRRTPEGFEVSWRSAPNDLGNPPVNYTYRYAFGSPSDWNYGSTLMTRFVLPSHAESTVYVAVQVSFGNGTKGPWISAPPIHLPTLT